MQETQRKKISQLGVKRVKASIGKHIELALRLGAPRPRPQHLQLVLAGQGQHLQYRQARSWPLEVERRL